MNSNFRRKGYSRSTAEDGEEESHSLLGQENISMSRIHSSPDMATVHPKKREDASPARAKPDQTIECEVQPSDTLRTLSLKYNIPVAELKRVNNIFSDAEFFARKRVKIPVKPNSLLLPELLGDERVAGGENGWYVDHRDISTTSMSSRVSSGMSSPLSTPCSERENQARQADVWPRHSRFINFLNLK